MSSTASDSAPPSEGAAPADVSTSAAKTSAVVTSASAATAAVPGDATTAAGGKNTNKPLLTRAFWRWLMITTILCVLWVLYNRHPYYLRQQFNPWRPVFNFAITTWLVLGIPYCYATTQRFSNRAKDMRESTLHWMLLVRGAWRGKTSHLFRSRRVKTSILSLFVKLFYAPLMTSFFSDHSNTISRMWAFRKHQPIFDAAKSHGFSDWWAYVTTTLPKLLPDGSDFGAIFDASWWNVANFNFAGDLYYNILFFVDCGWALFGYCLESQWLRNKTKSVEPTALGWAAALALYPPFNDITGTYLPLDQSHHFITNQTALIVFRVLVLAAFTIYAAATVSFGFKFSNLTNRGIISRGPYALVRHPAYLCKNFAWWMENLPNISLQSVFFLTLLNGMYFLRAWTEERHLSQDPDYVAYKKKVPWVFIPGVY